MRASMPPEAGGVSSRGSRATAHLFTLFRRKRKAGSGICARRPAPAEDHPELRVIGVPVHAEKRDVAARQETAVEADVEAAPETPIDAPVHVDPARAVG